MSGERKVVLIVALAVIGLVAFNLAVWRRLRIALAVARAEQERRDRDALP